MPERGRHRSADDNLVDDQIRQRFRACESLPLFPDPTSPLPPGFFQPPDIGAQLRLHEVRRE